MDDELVQQARTGDGDAFARLYASWFDRVYDLAYRILRDENAAADVAQHAFLTAYRDLERLRDPSAFGGWLLRITRNAAFDHRRREARSRPVEDVELAVSAAATGVEERLIAADDPARAAADADLAALVWESADALGERDAEVLDLTLRHELPPADIAEVLGINRNHANQLVHRARNRLGDAVRARVLWHGGDPVCPDLAAALSDAGITRFGADAVRVTTAHAEDCERCEERRKLKLAPVALFSAVPMLVAPTTLRERVTAALAGEGVPVGDGSSGAGGPDTGDGPEPQPEDTTSPPPRRPAGKVAAVAAAGVAAVAAVTLGVVWLAAGDGDDGSTSAIATEEETTTPTVAIETAPTTLPLETPTAPPDAPPATNAPEVAPPPATDPPPPPPAALEGSIVIQPATVSASSLFVQQPILSWQTSGAASVTVQGPGVSGSSLNDQVPVCPGTETMAGECIASPNQYEYLLTATAADGRTITRTAVLNVVA